MKPFRPGAALAALAPLLLLASGCASNPLPTARQGIPDPGPAPLSAVPAQPLDPALLSPTEAAYRIGPGDQLRVQATGHLPAEADVTVGPDGKIYFEYLAGIDVSGMTLPEAGGRVAADLGKFEREKPHVALFLRRAVSQQVWMLGRLASPGVYALDRPTTLLGAVAGAGGLEVDTSGGGARSESADLSGSFLIRNGHVVPVDFERLLRDGDQSQNVYLEADDFVFIPSLRSSRIHVLGAVLQPRTERFGGQLTLVQAIALAGGTIPEACLPNVAGHPRPGRPRSHARADLPPD